MEIDPETLRQYFRLELDKGPNEATAKVAQSLFAITDKNKVAAAAIVWTKLDGKCSERPVVVRESACGVPRGMMRRSPAGI